MAENKKPKIPEPIVELCQNTNGNDDIDDESSKDLNFSIGDKCWVESENKLYDVAEGLIRTMYVIIYCFIFCYYLIVM